MTDFLFDHCYSKHISKDDYQKIVDLGFTSTEQAVEHPGTQICRFIGFGFRAGYIEFAEIRDRDAFEKYKNESGFSLEDAECPGFSLRIEEKLEDVFEAKKDEFQEFGIQFEHKNYNWKENDKDYLPGFNFLTFKNQLIPGAFIWVTEYEKNPKYDLKKIKEELDQLKHENTVTGVLGSYWVMENKKTLDPFLRFFDLELKGNELSFKNEKKMYIDFGSNALSDYYRKEKASPFKAVILECKSLKTFKEVSGLTDEIYFREKTAVRFKQHKSAWDILVIEAEK